MPTAGCKDFDVCGGGLALDRANATGRFMAGFVTVDVSNVTRTQLDMFVVVWTPLTPRAGRIGSTEVLHKFQSKGLTAGLHIPFAQTINPHLAVR